MPTPLQLALQRKLEQQNAAAPAPAQPAAPRPAPQGTPPAGELTPLQQAAARADRRPDEAQVDKDTGTDAWTAFNVALQRSPEDVLAVVEKQYPGSQPFVERRGGATVRNGIQSWAPVTQRVLYTNPATGKLTVVDPEGWAQNAAALAPALLQGAAQTGAQVLAAPAGPVASVGAGVAADRGTNWLLRALSMAFGGGQSAPLGDPREELEQGAIAGLGGAGGELLGAGLRQGQRAVQARQVTGPAGPMGRPGMLDDLGTIARETGRKAEDVQRGGAALVSGNEQVWQKVRAAARDPRTSASFNREIDKTLSAVDDYAQKTLNKAPGTAATKREAGERLLGDLDDAAKNASAVQSGLESDWRASMGGGDVKLFPQRTQAVLQEMKAAASSPVEAGGDPQAMRALFPRELDDVLARVEASPEGLSLDLLRKIRTWAGENGGGSLMLPASRPELERLYGALTGDLEDAAKLQGGKAWADWVKGQNHWEQYATRRELLGTLARSRTGEGAFQAAFRGEKQGASLLEAVKRTVSDETWDDLARVKLFENAQRGQGERAVFDFGKFQKTWNQMPDDVRALLVADKDLRAAYDRLARVGDALGDSLFAANFSGTAQALLTAADMRRGVTDRLKDAAANATLGALGLTMESQAKLLSDPRFVRWLADSATHPLNDRMGWAYQLSRLAGIGTARGMEEPVRQYLETLRARWNAVQAEDSDPATRAASNEDARRAGIERAMNPEPAAPQEPPQ